MKQMCSLPDHIPESDILSISEDMINNIQIWLEPEESKKDSSA